MQSFDLVIVGGGLAGTSLAVALRNSRLKIALVESRPPERPSGWDARVYAVSPANVAFLDAIGAWKHLVRERIAPVSAMEIFGDAGGRLDFSAYDSGVAELAWILESSLMACELWETVKRQTNLTLFCPSQPATLEFNTEAALLKLEDGTLLSSRLIVGADGRNSWVREQSSLEAVSQPYREKGVVANFSTEKSHRNVARQWFRDDGILAWLPLPGNRISMVWSTSDVYADELVTLSPAELCARVKKAGKETLGDLDLITPAAAFSLQLLRVQHTVAPRLALIGDAAHGIHPLSGHGINLGFQDARELSGLLGDSHPWQDIGEERFLRRYQRARKEETLLMQAATDSLHRLFRANPPGLKSLRNFGLEMTNALPLAKNLLVRYALGAI